MWVRCLSSGKHTAGADPGAFAGVCGYAIPCGARDWAVEVRNLGRRIKPGWIGIDAGRGGPVAALKTSNWAAIALVWATVSLRSMESCP